MSQPPDPTDQLQFNTVEASSAPGAIPMLRLQSCVVCKRPITSLYFAVRDKILCPDCAVVVRTGATVNPVVGFLKATAYGLAAAIAGAVVWGAILYYTHYQIGYVALLVGYMVGKSIRKGSGGRGGAGYQIMAIVLTYGVAAAAHFPLAYEAFSSRSPQPVAVIIVESVILCAMDPIANGMKNPIGLLILGIALWEAWKFTKYQPIPLTGPYQLTVKALPIALAPLPEPTPAPPPGVII